MMDDPGIIGVRFTECVSCRWLRSGRCIRCGAGEFFEETNTSPRELNDEELMQIYSEMTDDE